MERVKQNGLILNQTNKLKKRRKLIMKKIINNFMHDILHHVLHHVYEYHAIETCIYRQP